MKQVYANLLGNWVELTDGATIEKYDPVTWYKGDGIDLMDQFCYVNVQFRGANYRVHSSQIQIIGG